MHKAGNSFLWLDRPLSLQLLQYAANDIYLIYSVFSQFLIRGWINSSAAGMRVLLEQSSRHVACYKNRNYKMAEEQLGASRVIHMDVLINWSANSNNARHQCLRCHRLLSLSCFEHTTVSRPKSTTFRQPWCRRCALCAQEKEIAYDQTWIAL